MDLDSSTQENIFKKCTGAIEFYYRTYNATHRRTKEAYDGNHDGYDVNFSRNKLGNT